MLDGLHKNIDVASVVVSSIEPWSKQASYEELQRLGKICSELTMGIRIAQSPLWFQLVAISDEPSLDEWKNIKVSAERVANNVTAVIDALKIEKGDFIVEALPVFRELVFALEGRREILKEISRMQYPLRPSDVNDVRKLGKSYKKLLISLDKVQEDLARYIARKKGSLADAPPRPEKNAWKENMITLCIVLLAILFSFFFMNLTAAIAFSFCVLVVSPVLLAYTQKAHTFESASLLELYKVGLSQMLVGIKSLSKPSASGTRNDNPPENKP